jgi:uncharacterized protein
MQGKSNMTERFVLDAWAILALLQGEEPAVSRVRELLAQAQSEQVELLMSIINVGEVYYRIGRACGQDQARKTLELVRELPVTILPAANETVFAAATVKMAQAISYADAFAAAAAIQHQAILVTGDPELLSLRDVVPTERLQRRSASRGA